VTSSADNPRPPAVDDTDTTWRDDLSEWAGYYWKRLHQHEAATWPPPWGPSALAIGGIAALVLVVGGILVPMVRGLASFVMGGAEWVSSTAAAGIVLQPVRRYLDGHGAGLPVDAGTLWWTWCATGLLLFVLSTLLRSPAARLGWVLFGAASTTMVYDAAAAPTQPVAAGVTVIWWVTLSFAALRRRLPTARSAVDSE
jgi:hypothetical protein